MGSPPCVLNFSLLNISMPMTKLVRICKLGNKPKDALTEDSVCKEVSVAVNDAETRLIFVDHQHGDMSVRLCAVFFIF